MSLPSSLLGHLDSDGRIARLPAKHSKRIALCLALLEQINRGSTYSEKQINEIFLQTVDDFAFVRRTLVDMGYLERDRYGKSYRRTAE